MKGFFSALARGLALLLLGGVLIYEIWQPVLPSRWVIEGMAKAIVPPALPEGEERVVRFHLSGKGGGVYNLVIGKGGVRVVEGASTDRLDLILLMEAADFNDLMISLARGKADEFTFRRMVISKIMRFAGDLRDLELISQKRQAEE